MEQFCLLVFPVCSGRSLIYPAALPAQLQAFPVCPDYIFTRYRVLPILSPLGALQADKALVVEPYPYLASQQYVGSWLLIFST